jgi:hypothetical protein
MQLKAFQGQSHFEGDDSVFRKAMKSGALPSLICGVLPKLEK